MSRLDNLYTYFRRYCREIANLRKGAILTQIVLYDDGSGRIETKLYKPTESNPFNAFTEEIIRFGTPHEGAMKLKELVDAVPELSKG